MVVHGLPVLTCMSDTIIYNVESIYLHYSFDISKLYVISELLIMYFFKIFCAPQKITIAAHIKVAAIVITQQNEFPSIVWAKTMCDLSNCRSCGVQKSSVTPKMIFLRLYEQNGTCSFFSFFIGWAKNYKSWCGIALDFKQQYDSEPNLRLVSCS